MLHSVKSSIHYTMASQASKNSVKLRNLLASSSGNSRLQQVNDAGIRTKLLQTLFPNVSTINEEVTLIIFYTYFAYR